jgi:hypothetical protein
MLEYGLFSDQNTQEHQKHTQTGCPELELESRDLFRLPPDLIGSILGRLR